MRILLIIILILILVIMLIGGYSYNWDWWIWTGLGEFIPQTTLGGVEIQRAKTLWDWFGLLLIPFVLSSVAVWFNQKERETERIIADDRLREQALQTYFDRMTELLLDKENPLRRLETKGETRIVARTRTLTVLRQLDGERKGHLLQFLYESHLIDGSGTTVELKGADLRKAHLAGSNLYGANLAEVNLEGANLEGTNLEGAKLVRANLVDATLVEASLVEASLAGAKLYRANFKRAILYGTNLREAHLEGACFEGAQLQGAHLDGAHINLEDLSTVSSFENVSMPDGTNPDSLSIKRSSQIKKYIKTVRSKLFPRKMG